MTGEPVSSNQTIISRTASSWNQTSSSQPILPTPKTYITSINSTKQKMLPISSVGINIRRSSPKTQLNCFSDSQSQSPKPSRAHNTSNQSHGENQPDHNQKNTHQREDHNT